METLLLLLLYCNPTSPIPIDIFLILSAHPGLSLNQYLSLFPFDSLDSPLQSISTSDPIQIIKFNSKKLPPKVDHYIIKTLICVYILAKSIFCILVLYC